MSEQTGVEQKEKDTEMSGVENPEQMMDPEEADPGEEEYAPLFEEAEEYEDSDAISVEEETSDKPIVKNIFDLKTFEPVLKEGEEPYDDFTEEDRKDNPELFLTDEEVNETL